MREPSAVLVRALSLCACVRAGERAYVCVCVRVRVCACACVCVCVCYKCEDRPLHLLLEMTVIRNVEHPAVDTYMRYRKLLDIMDVSLSMCFCARGRNGNRDEAPNPESDVIIIPSLLLHLKRLCATPSAVSERLSTPTHSGIHTHTHTPVSYTHLTLPTKVNV